MPEWCASTALSYFLYLLPSTNRVIIIETFLKEMIKLHLNFVFWLTVGLQILYTLLKNMEQEDAAQSFYQTYYVSIVQHVFSVVTDTSHTAGKMILAFIMHSETLVM